MCEEFRNSRGDMTAEPAEPLPALTHAYLRRSARCARSTIRNICTQSQKTPVMHAEQSPPQSSTMLGSFVGTCGATNQ